MKKKEKPSDEDDVSIIERFNEKEFRSIIIIITTMVVVVVMVEVVIMVGCVRSQFHRF